MTIYSYFFELLVIDNQSSHAIPKYNFIILEGCTGYFREFIISGDVGLRKPDPAIYQLLIGRLKCKADEILFVDDNVRNLDAAAGQGIATVLFDSSGRALSVKHRVVSSFAELGTLIA